MRRDSIDPAQLGSRLTTLTRRHRAIDTEIKVELSRPYPDTAALQYLKRKRLHLKEQIARLARSAGNTASCAN